MAYFPDLSGFEDSRDRWKRRTFNIGWLDRAHQFEVGRPPKWLVNKLWDFSQYSVHEARGFHECNLPNCPGPMRRLKNFYIGGRTPTARELQQTRAALREVFQKRLPNNAITREMIAMLDEQDRKPPRKFFKRILGIRPGHDVRLELGSAQIRVFGDRGQIYAAPNMLFHYVTAHHYKPPDEFIQALRHGPCPPDKEYFNRLKSLGLVWKRTRCCERP